jgi:16S rRNA (cytosine1402-N4)-methyltransferase
MNKEKWIHIPVMEKEVVKTFNSSLTGNNKVFIDATVGLGGHLQSIDKKYKPNIMIGYDRDNEAIKIAKKRVKIAKFYNKLYSQINQKADGILFDLGVSSMQIDNTKRGFSYMKNGNLDMRMDRNQNKTAEFVINNYSHNDLRKIIKEYGGEIFANKITTGIVEKRKSKPIKTTLELVQIIIDSIPKNSKRKGAISKKTFQAIRIEVNDEMKILENAIKNAINHLKVGGIIAILTYHSLEDKVVQRTLKKYSKTVYLKNVPIPVKIAKIKLLKKQKPKVQEITNNKRAKSATLRSAIKL